MSTLAKNETTISHKDQIVKNPALLLVLIVFMFGVILSFVGNISCAYTSFHVQVTDKLMDNAIHDVNIKYGLWSYQKASFNNNEMFDGNSRFDVGISDGCYIYGADMPIDTHWKRARVFAVLAMITGGLICLLTQYGMVCCCYEKPWEMPDMVCLVIGLSLTTMFQGFSFLFFQSEACRSKSLQTSVVEQNSNNNTFYVSLPSFYSHKYLREITYDRSRYSMDLISNDCPKEKGSMFATWSFVLLCLSTIIVMSMIIAHPYLRERGIVQSSSTKQDEASLSSASIPEVL